MTRPLGFSVYAVTDPKLCAPDWRASVDAAIDGGAGAIQLRNKEATTLELYRQALLLREVTSSRGVLLFINDRIDVALAVGADGVHVGHEDIPATIARRIWPRPGWLGVSAANPEAAVAAELAGADYVGCGPTFQTDTKVTGRDPLGPKGLRRIVSAVSIPVVAIGGIHARNAAQLRGCGAQAVAVVSGIFGWPQGPAEAAAQILAAFSRGRD